MERTRTAGKCRRIPSPESDSENEAPNQKRSRRAPNVKQEMVQQEREREREGERERQREQAQAGSESESDMEQASGSGAFANGMSRTSSRIMSHFSMSMELQPPGIFDRCGKVMSMRLTNFMCHSNLAIDFGPNINFLVGNNGSGKSAVITALALGLTSSARATSRASSLQKLIKNGEVHASISITLCNWGLQPYKPDVFGPQITVVRHLRQSSSTYELHDARGRTVSKKVTEIQRMLLFMGINVENPAFVLNQEAAREFLKDLEPSSNYRLLMKATQLDRCANSLTQCHEQRRLLSLSLGQLDRNTKVLAEKLKADEDKLTTVRGKELVQEKLEQAQTKLAWLSVTHYQKELQKTDDSIGLIKAKKDKLEQSTQKNARAQLTQQLTDFRSSRQALLDSYKAQEARLKEAKKAHQEIYFQASTVKAQIGNAEKRLREEEHTFKECDQYIKSYHADFSRVQEQRDENSAKLGTLKTQLDDGEARVVRLRDELKQIKRSTASVQEALESAIHGKNQLHKKRDQVKWEIDAINRNKSNKLSVYGEQSIQLVHALRTLFSGGNQHRMPRGPVGQYISTPNSKFRDLVENQLMSCLRSYIVNSDADRQSFRGLLKKKFAGMSPTIITTKFTDRVYDVSRHKVRPTTPNTTVLMDEISCEDPVVMNYLIDTFRIETVLVTESKEIAEFLTSDTENVPPNLTRVLVPNLRLEYIPSPHYAVYSMRIQPSRFIQVNVEDRIQQLQVELSGFQEEEAALEANYRHNKKLMENTNIELTKRSALIGQQQEKNEIAMKLKMELENFEYPVIPEYDRLKTALSDSSDKMDKCRVEIQELKEKLGEINETESSMKTDEAKERKTLDEIQGKLSAIDNESSKIDSQLRSLELNFEENARKLKKVVDLERTTLNHKKSMETELEKARAAAEEMGEFVDTTETEEDLQELISRYKSKIRQVEQLNYNCDELEQQVEALREEVDQKTKEVKLFNSVMNNLRMAYHHRAQLYQRSRLHYFTMVQFQFEHALSMRQFNVSFETNDKDKTWKINVLPPSGNKTSNTRSLSGGERSFTTVSLLKGLWTTSDHPFYFLDEYDVFTDEVNRRFITEILVREGTECRTRQYCFLTPQDTEVKASNLIKVHRLEAPEH